MCEHKHVTIIGNDETGAKYFQCDDCKEYLHRILENGEFVYVSKEKDEV